MIKLLEGTQGIGVVLAETKKAAESVIEAFMGVKNQYPYYRNLLKKRGVADIRCFVVGGKVM